MPGEGRYPLFKSLVRVVFGVALAFATIYLTIRAHSEAGNEDTPREVWAAALLLGLASAMNLIGPIWQQIRTDRSERFSREVEARLISLWFAMRHLGTVEDLLRVGIQVWVVPKWHWKLAPYSLTSRLPSRLRLHLPTPAMTTPGEFRPRDETTSSNIYWRRGKGVIGQCWQRREVISWNNQSDLPQDMSEAKWDALDKVARLGLKRYEDYRRLTASYGQVVSVPIERKVRKVGQSFVIGCLVLDAPPQWDPKVDIHADEVVSMARTAALDIRGLIV